MSAEHDDLREMAANRGCKLVKSRRRKPGGDFDRYGLKDAKTGKALLGFGPKGFTATAEEIRAFLRGGAAESWKSSLSVAGEAKPPATRRKRDAPTRPEPRHRAERRATARPEPRRRSTSPRPEPRRRPTPKREEPQAPKPPKIREVRPADADAIADLLVQLGYEVKAAQVQKRLAVLRKAGEPALVADRDGVIGCLTWHVTPVIHRPRPVGRITMLVVAETERGSGIGAALVEAAEARLRDKGCGLIEVTSNLKRMRAHAFYERLGYDRTSYRFSRTLQE